MSRKRISARQQMRNIIDEGESNKEILIENPMKYKIRLNQFPWTEKQKDFFKIALHKDTKIVFVNGPAGTSKNTFISLLWITTIKHESNRRYNVF